MTSSPKKRSLDSTSKQKSLELKTTRGAPTSFPHITMELDTRTFGRDKKKGKVVPMLN
jgi:hypothetical protein